MNTQSGQTLIETLVASFILVMGISAALGLATYSLGATTNIRQQTIALGLSREGIEVVKNIRDTNWLKGTLTADCYDFLSGDSVAYCYRDWLNPDSGLGQDISAPAGGRTFALRYNPSLPNPWYLYETGQHFGLNLNDLSVNDTGLQNVLYSAEDGLTVLGSSTKFGRAITISEDADFTPFDQDTGPRLRVTSHVWWTDGKNCPQSNTPPADKRCSVYLVTYLTNWRNF